MIRPNELRPGNLVLNGKIISLVKSAEGSVVRFDYNTRSWYELGKLKPIKITESHIQNCNFNFKKNGFDALSVIVMKSSDGIFFKIGNYYKRIYFLHQLQNLYFDLTDEQLTFKK